MDDGMMMPKMNMQNSTHLPAVPGQKNKREKHDKPMQNVFRRVVRKASSRGMVVNNQKTKLLCMSDANTYRAAAYIYNAEGTRLDTTGNLKVLGFHLDGRPTVHSHVAALQTWMRETTWILRHLKLNGFNERERESW